MLDNTRPTLTLSHPHAGTNKALAHVLVGMHDYYTGLDMNSFEVIADVEVDGMAAGRTWRRRPRRRLPAVLRTTSRPRRRPPILIRADSTKPQATIFAAMGISPKTAFEVVGEPAA